METSKSELPSQPSAGKQLLRGHLRPEFNQGPVVGALSDTMILHLAIGLPHRNSTQLDALIRTSSDPTSAQFRQYLSPAEFVEQFGPTDQDYKALVAFCEQADGLTVTNTYSSRALLDIVGSVAAIKKAFYINLITRHRPDGTIFYAPDREPSLDLDLPVLHITGLDNYSPPKAHVGSAPNGEFGGSDFRNAYAPGVTLTGEGQSVGIFELDGFYNADPNAYKSKFGLNVPVLVVTLNGFSQNAVSSGPNGAPNNDIEVALDIEMAMAMAPGLESVVVYEGSNEDSVLAAMASPPTGPLCLQLSMSYTFRGTNSPNTLQSVNKMAAQGQTFFVCAGDGRALCASEFVGSRTLPNVTVVGGTALTMSGEGAAWQSETAAPNGGGVLIGEPIPPYQLGLATAANGGSDQWRMIPDVALVSSNIFIFWNNGQTANVGGTSASTPLWAAYAALANQAAKQAGRPPLGFINPLIYMIGRQLVAYARDFHDMQSGSSKGQAANSPCPTTYVGYDATVGYDLISGWGTPTASLIDDLANPSQILRTAQAGQCSQAVQFLQQIIKDGGPLLTVAQYTALKTSLEKCVAGGFVTQAFVNNLLGEYANIAKSKKGGP